MNSVVNFILESGISLALLSLIYIAFLRKETFFRINRIFLLFSILFSILLPFLKFRIYNPQAVMLPEVTVSQYRDLIEAVTVYGHDLSGSIERAVLSTNLLIAIYLLGFLFFLGRSLFSIIQLGFLIKKSMVTKMDGFNLVIVDKNSSPFSFLNYIFISKTLNENMGCDRMIAHELEHIKQGHSFDILILEVLTAFHWFNPFMWILKRVIRENHEFLADQGVLTSGVSKGQYKELLLHQFVGGRVSLTNNFNYSLIKKRIKMMSRIRSSRTANIKLIFGIAVMIALVIAFACEQKETMPLKEPLNNETLKVTIQDGKLKVEGDIDGLEKIKTMFSGVNEFEVSGSDTLGFLIVNKKVPHIRVLDKDEPIFSIVEKMPVFPGGEAALSQFITRSVKYPKIAQANGIQGRVYVSFVVTKDGSIANVNIARGVDPSLDLEALRVINSLPGWKSGYQKGEPVNVSYTVPIKFELQ